MTEEHAAVLRKYAFLKDGRVWARSSNRPYATQADAFGYRKLNIGRKAFFEHRVIWFLHYGQWPTGSLDHINRVKTDNRIENLREADAFEQAVNRERRGRGGVYFCPTARRWRASITVRNKRHWLGSYLTREDAIIARLAAEREFGVDIPCSTPDRAGLGVSHAASSPTFSGLR